MKKLKNNVNRRLLMLYASSQTYTSTVFEHLDSFRRFSDFEWHYTDYSDFSQLGRCLDAYSAIVVHYSVRLPFGCLSDSDVNVLREFQGLKVLFIQDEYDGFGKAQKIIAEAEFQLVFSVVPEKSLHSIYEPRLFPSAKFITNLTGYVPNDLCNSFPSLGKTSTREIEVAYRGRTLPLRYGRLGRQKVQIGQSVKDYCIKNGFTSDISWDDGARIYGKEWYEFIAISKAMLGSESGCNVFDHYGNLDVKIEEYRRKNPLCSDEDILKDIIDPLEIDGLMNQLSPRIFEMAAAKTAMVLIEGFYSGVVEPYKHYIPLKSDYSNLDEVFERLADSGFVDSMVERAYNDLILSDKYSYRGFVSMVDEQISCRAEECEVWKRVSSSKGMYGGSYSVVHLAPKLAPIPPVAIPKNPFGLIYPMLVLLWKFVPLNARPYIKTLLGKR